MEFVSNLFPLFMLLPKIKIHYKNFNCFGRGKEEQPKEEAKHRTKMASLKLTRRLSSYFPASVKSGWSPRAFVTATRPLQKSKSEKEECEKVTEAAESVKEGAKEVRKTCEFMRDTASSAAESVTKMTKEVSEKVSETTENITDAAKGTVQKIKEKVSGK
ncbi:unnamed protein product [Camellia sinensis]